VPGDTVSCLSQSHATTLRRFHSWVKYGSPSSGKEQVAFCCNVLEAARILRDGRNIDCAFSESDGFRLLFLGKEGMMQSLLAARALLHDSKKFPLRNGAHPHHHRASLTFLTRNAPYVGSGVRGVVVRACGSFFLPRCSYPHWSARPPPHCSAT